MTTPCVAILTHLMKSFFAFYIQKKCILHVYTQVEHSITKSIASFLRIEQAETHPPLQRERSEQAEVKGTPGSFLA